jgi:hypothetical protein
LDCKTQLKEIFSEALADLSRMEAMTKWLATLGQIHWGQLLPWTQFLYWQKPFGVFFHNQLIQNH